MPANVQTMAYRGETPWHGMGKTITPGMSVKEIQTLAEMDYTIELLDIGARTGEMLPINKRSFQKVEGYKLVWSPELGQAFQIATDRYHPVQPSQVMDFFVEFCERGELEIETAGVLKDGAINWCLAKTTDSFTLAGGDKNETFVLLATSHDGSIVTSALPTSIRVVCHNTLSMSLNAAKAKGTKAFKMKHSSKFTEAKIEKAKETVGLTISAAQRFAESASKLAGFKITKEMQENLVLKLTQPKLMEEIAEDTMKVQAEQQSNRSVLLDIIESHEINRRAKDLDQNRVGKAILEAIAYGPGANMPSAQDTLWGVINGVSYYVDHVASSSDRDKALTSAWFGTRANLKSSILDLCMEMVEIEA